MNFLLVLVIPAMFSCQENLFSENELPASAGIKLNASAISASLFSDTISAGCDPNVWKHVYNPSRLKVIDNCITVSGVITESHAEGDGDQHLLLKPDAAQQNLLKKKNIQKKNGCLVIEAICINNISEKKVGGACKGYVNHITIPKIGAHVKVTGSYVLDSHNGWAEIHPVSKIVIQ